MSVTTLEAAPPVESAEESVSAVEWRIETQADAADLTTLDGCSCGCSCGCGCGGISV